MAKNVFTKITSPRGAALYPFLKTPEVYEGQEVGYTIQAMFSKEDTDRIIEALEKELDKAKKSDSFKGKKWSRDPHMGYRENKDGDIVFKFKTKATVKTRSGEEVKRTVPVFDAKGNSIDVAIGNGSIVRIAFQVVPFHKSSTLNGVTLFLDAVQVIELVEYGGNNNNANAFGFDEEEGYTSDNVANQFDDEEEEVGNASNEVDF